MKAMMTSTALVAVALFMGPATAQQQQQQLTGTAQYCLKGAGPVKCEYHTMAHCEQAKPGSSDQCLPRSQVEGSSTVGGPAPGEQKD
jgi:hypothetical protein